MRTRRVTGFTLPNKKEFLTDEYTNDDICFFWDELKRSLIKEWKIKLTNYDMRTRREILAGNYFFQLNRKSVKLVPMDMMNRVNNFFDWENFNNGLCPN